MNAWFLLCCFYYFSTSFEILSAFVILQFIDAVLILKTIHTRAHFFYSMFFFTLFHFKGTFYCLTKLNTIKKRYKYFPRNDTHKCNSNLSTDVTFSFMYSTLLSVTIHTKTLILFLLLKYIEVDVLAFHFYPINLLFFHFQFNPRKKWKMVWDFVYQYYMCFRDAKKLNVARSQWNNLHKSIFKLSMCQFLKRIPLKMWFVYACIVFLFR